MIRASLLASLILVSTACAEDGAPYDPMVDDESADGVGLSVEFISDRSLTETSDYEELDGTELSVEVIDNQVSMELWTHDIAVFEPERYAFFSTDSDSWRLVVSQGLTSELGNLLLTPAQMTECHSVSTGEQIVCPSSGQTARFTEVLIDSQEALVHVRAVVEDFDMRGTLRIDGRAIKNFFHVIPFPLDVQGQQATMTIEACNQADCWL